jgi:rapamycin-insensitive companion of mTOR
MDGCKFHYLCTFRGIHLDLQGNIGATDGGLPFLEEEEIIPVILDIAEQSPIPSVRGCATFLHWFRFPTHCTCPRTCFYVLSLISSTSQGAEILDDYQWEATLSPLGTPTGLCMPVDVEKFMSVSVRSMANH